jgi:hypothetical protein
MTVKERRRYATVTRRWSFLYNILKGKEKMQRELKHIHVFNKALKTYKL